MQNHTRRIVPHLWFDREAKAAAEFYTGLFPDSKVTNVTTLHNTPSGDTDIVSFELAGQPFMAMSAGPLFKFNPSTSFILNYDPSKDKQAREHLDRAWEKLIDGGTVLMPLEEYPFSKHYGWVQDRYGLSWQLMLTDPAGEERPFVTPSLLFVADASGKAEAAIEHYMNVFRNAKRGMTVRYPAGMEPEKEGTIMYADFMVENTWLAAMDSANDQHKFQFNEAISFMIPCDTQEEIDYYWGKLSADSNAEQCGWLKDKFGISWQVTPTVMNEMMQRGSREQIDRLTQAFLPMKKFDLAKLRAAYEGSL